MHSLRRALALVASNEQLVSHPTTLILQSYSTTVTRKIPKSSQKSSSMAPKSPNDAVVSGRPRLTDISFQPKVANFINVIGNVHMPIQFETSPDGKSWAATVIKREKSLTSPELWIPAIFEGDLAHIAACHLKENDCIYIAGQLSADPPYLDEKLGQSNVQILVQDFNFVQGYSEYNRSSFSEQEEISSSSASREYDIDPSWKDLLSNPDEWWDVRSTEDNPISASFEHKKNGALLFIDNSTPKWLLEKLKSTTFDRKTELKSSGASATKASGSLLDSWRDLLDNPKEWQDYRDRKINKLVNPRHPDFKRKDSGVSLWLNKAPKWVLSKGLEFDVQVGKSTQAKEHKDQAKDREGDQSWRELVENPAKWWDNRSNKKNQRAPDFKHKDTGEALWLKRIPSWALSKLPPLKTSRSDEAGRQHKLVF